MAMESKSLLAFLILVSVIWVTQAQNPCEEGVYRVMNEPDRSQDFANQDSPKCDDGNGLTPGWVRFSGSGGTVMSTSRPYDKRCNTHAPGYLRGGHPTYEEGTVERQVCFGYKSNSCLKDVMINVRNCGGFYVYELKKLGFCKLRYCTNPSAPPPVSPVGPDVPMPTPSIKVEAKAADLLGGKKVQVIARCTLTGEKSENVELEASWFIDGVKVAAQLSEGSEDFELKELEHGFKAGTTISCQIRGRKKGGDQRWSAYKKSKKIFTGITITPDSLTVREDGPGMPIVASIAFPITGTGTYFGMCGDIVLKVTRGGASPKDVALSKSLWTIPAGELKSDKLIVTAIRDFVKDGRKKMKVFVSMVCDEPGESQFWKGYKVMVKKGSGKRSRVKRNDGDTGIDITSEDEDCNTCHSCGDPHMKTLDNKYYNHLRNPGDYILTKNPQRNFEIHARIWKCWRTVCNCAVAIRENNDVIKVDACNRRGAPRVVQLSRESLKGRVIVKRMNRGRYTEIRLFFKSGTDVKVHCYGKYVNLLLTIPSDDFKRTEGLCGNNNNNANDEYSNEGFFKRQQKIPAGQSLFYKLPAKVPTPPDVCGSKENGNVGYKLSCTVNRPGVNLNYGANVNPAKGYLPYGGRRRKRYLTMDAAEERKQFFSEDDYEYHEMYNEFHNSDFFKRTSAEDLAVIPQWGEMGVTEAQAKAKCTAVLVDSAVGKACAAMDISIDDRMDECLVDIQVTGDLSIADSALSSLTNLCVDNALKNPDLYEKDENGNMVPPTSILGAICPGDCSGKGHCKDGKCECNEGFGAEDCSIDLNKPPEVTGIQGDGLCDLRKRKCKSIRLEGSKFLDSKKLTCHFQPFKFEDGQAVADGDVVKTRGVLESMLEVACPYPEADQDKLPWKYFVSVSNNGVDQSGKNKTVVYHSYCSSCEKSGECAENVDETKACVIDGICHGRQTSKQGDVCLKCQPDVDSDHWTEYKYDGCPICDMKDQYSVCEGQTFKLDLPAGDPELGMKVNYVLDEGSPAGSSVAGGVFTWDVTGKDKTSASIAGSYECGEARVLKITMTVSKCKCENGGKCLSDTEDSPDCAFSLRCECPAGFSGNRCQIRG